MGLISSEGRLHWVLVSKKTHSDFFSKNAENHKWVKSGVLFL